MESIVGATNWTNVRSWALSTVSHIACCFACVVDEWVVLHAWVACVIGGWTTCAVLYSAIRNASRCWRIRTHHQGEVGRTVRANVDTWTDITSRHIAHRQASTSVADGIVHLTGQTNLSWSVASQTKRQSAVADTNWRTIYIKGEVGLASRAGIRSWANSTVGDIAGKLASIINNCIVCFAYCTCIILSYTGNTVANSTIWETWPNVSWSIKRIESAVSLAATRRIIQQLRTSWAGTSGRCHSCVAYCWGIGAEDEGRRTEGASAICWALLAVGDLAGETFVHSCVEDKSCVALWTLAGVEVAVWYVAVYGAVLGTWPWDCCETFHADHTTAWYITSHTVIMSTKHTTGINKLKISWTITTHIGHQTHRAVSNTTADTSIIIRQGKER